MKNSCEKIYTEFYVSECEKRTMEGSKVSPDKNLHEEEEEVIARLIQDFNFGETSDNNNKDVTNEEVLAYLILFIVFS